MGVCWYCHWGWPQVVCEIYKRGYDIAGESAMSYGPAHIVWEDENFETEHIQWCIDHAVEYRRDLTDEQFNAVVTSLRELLAVPEAIRCCEPTDYDDRNPAKFPPPANIIMGRIYKWITPQKN